MRRRELLGIVGEVDEGDGRVAVNGYICVNLDLPSGLLWATKNFLASDEVSNGGYYKFGGLESEQENPNSIYYNGMADPIPYSRDIVNLTMGGTWRIPTVNDVIELQLGTGYTWIPEGGKEPLSHGRFLKNSNHNKHIDFYAHGAYDGYDILNGDRQESVVFTSSPVSYSEYMAYTLKCTAQHGGYNTYDRNGMCQLRPVVSL